MNKKMKIITLILSCVLLIGAAVGITVSAEQNPPTVKIAGQNISYEGAVKVAYYIPAEGLEGYTVKVLSKVSETFTYGKTVGEKLTYSEDVTVSVATDKVTIEGTEYLIGYSEGIAPKKLRDNVYSVAIVVDENDAIVAVSANKKYSVYNYAMNRFNGESTDEQYALYTALLNYGAAVQAVLGYNAEAGKWADEYYIINQTTTVNDTATNSVQKIRGTQIPDRAQYELVADKWADNDKSVIFTGFTGADGESYLGENYSANWNKISLRPGEYTINKNYATANGVYNTFDFGSSYEDNHLTTNITGDDVAGDKWASIGGDADNGYFQYGKNITGQGADFQVASTAVATNDKASDYYVVEFEFFVNNTGNTGADTHIGQFWVNGVGPTGGNGHIWGVNVYGNATNKTFRLKVDSGSEQGKVIASSVTENMNYNEWHNIRIEFYTNLGELYRQRVEFYIDGLYAGTYTGLYSNNVTDYGLSTKYVQYAATLAGMSVNMNYASKNTTFMFDDLYVGVVEKDFVFGQGVYANLYEDQVQDFENVAQGSDLGWLDYPSFGNTPITWEDLVGDGSASKTGYNWSTIEGEGNKTINIGKVASYAPSKITDTNTMGISGTFASSVRFTPTTTVGDKFVLEADFRLNYTSPYVWDGGAFRGQGDNWFARFGFTTGDSNWSSAADGHVIFYPNFENGTIKVGNANGAEVITMGDWVNMRMEYTPTGVDSSGKCTYKLELFIDGASVYTKSGTSPSADNTIFKGVYMEGRGYVLESSMSFDNMFVGAVGTRGDYEYMPDASYQPIDYSTNNTGYDKGTLADFSYDGTTKNNSWAGIYTQNGDEYLQMGHKNGTNFRVKYDVDGKLGDTYVLATDYTLMSTKGAVNEKGSSHPWVSKIAMFSGEEGSDFIYALFVYAEGTNYVIKTSDHTVIATAPMGQWMNIQMEYTPFVKDGGGYAGNVSVCIDGEVVYEKAVGSAKDNTTYKQAYFEARGYVSDIVFGVDNTLVTSVFNHSEDFTDVTNKITSSKNAVKVTNDADGNGVFHFGIADQANNVKTGENHAYYYFGDGLGQAIEGSVYELTYKIRMNKVTRPQAGVDYNGTTYKKARSSWMCTGLLTDKVMTTSFANATVESDITGYTGYDDETVAKLCEVELTEGEWYEVKYYVVVTAASDGVLDYSIKYTVSSDGAATKTKTGSFSGATNIIGIGFKTYAVNNDHGYMLDLDFDIDDLQVKAYNTVKTVSDTLVNDFEDAEDDSFAVSGSVNANTVKTETVGEITNNYMNVVKPSAANTEGVYTFGDKNDALGTAIQGTEVEVNFKARFNDVVVKNGYSGWFFYAGLVTGDVYSDYSTAIGEFLLETTSTENSTTTVVTSGKGVDFDYDKWYEFRAVYKFTSVSADGTTATINIKIYMGDTLTYESNRTLTSFKGDIGGFAFKFKNSDYFESYDVDFDGVTISVYNAV